MANPTMTLISSQTVGAGGVATVTFSSIPQIYTDLVVKISARTNRTSTAQDNLKININGASASQSVVYLQGSGTAVVSGSTGATVAITGSAIADDNDTASVFGNTEIYIPNYTGSTFKSVSVDSVGENNAVAAGLALVAGLYAATTAITSLVFTPETGTLINQYSTFYLYGIKNS